MNKLNIVLISLIIVFFLVLSFVVYDIYLKKTIVKQDSLLNSTIQGKKQHNDSNNQNPNNNEHDTNNPATKVISDFSKLNFDTCINNTKDNPQCKDCCDCLNGTDSKTRTFCRDTCAAHDFSKNSNIITITVPSILGKDADYSQCVNEGNSMCKTCCENEIGLVCGDYQYCRTACNLKFGDPKHNITSTNSS